MYIQYDGVQNITVYLKEVYSQTKLCKIKLFEISLYAQEIKLYMKIEPSRFNLLLLLQKLLLPI